jgi:hypothetical protein
MTGQWPQAIALAALPTPIALALTGLAAWFLLRWLRQRKAGK